MKRLFTLLVFSLLLSAAWAVPALAQDGQPTPTADDVNAIAKQLFCPVCENTPLDVCPTQACAQWRDLIRLQLSEGRSEDEIKQYFVVQYGARVLSEPPASGLNWLVYLVPPVLFLAGAFLLYRTFRSWNKPVQVAQVEPAEPQPADEYVRQLEEELRKRS